MASGYLDTVLGVQEGGSAGLNILAALKQAGISTGAYAPWIVGGSMAVNTLGKFLGSAADRKYDRQQYRLGNQQLELNALQIEATKAAQAEERKKLRKQKALSGVLSRVFGTYQQMKGAA